MEIKFFLIRLRLSFEYGRVGKMRDFDVLDVCSTLHMFE